MLISTFISGSPSDKDHEQNGYSMSKPDSRGNKIQRSLFVKSFLPVFALLLSFALFFLQQHEWMPLVNLEKQTISERFKWRGPLPKDDRIIILAIDDVSKELDAGKLREDEIQIAPLQLMLKGWPFPRETYSYVIDRLIQSGAKVVAFDMLFPSESIHGKKDDEKLAQALEENYSQVVVGANIQNAKTPGVSETGNLNGISLPVDSLMLEHSSEYVGFVNYFPGIDGVIRYAVQEVSKEVLAGASQTTDIQEWQQKYFSWDAQVAKKVDPSIRLRPYLNPGMINYQGPAGSYREYSLYEMFLPSFWESNFKNGAFFKGKIVLIGPTGNWTQDYHETPYGQMAGVEIHANAIATILRDNYLNELFKWWTNALIILFSILAVVMTVQFARNIWLSAVGFLVILICFCVIGQIAFEKYLLIIPMAWALVGIIMMEGVGLVYRITIEKMEQSRIRSTFDRFVSKNVASYILKNREEYEQALGGVRKPVTVLFSDIRGFTTMTESADAGALVEQLNEYFSEMVPCVFRHGGTLHKFIGDAVMAVWGDTHSLGLKEDALAALRSICEMTELLRKLNVKWKAVGKEELKIGVGLNHGDVIVGYIGSPERMEFTVIGDAINLGSRLEGATKEFKTDKLIGESVAQFVREEFWLQSAGVVKVKGKTKPVGVFIPICEKGKEPPDFRQSWLEKYEKAYALYMDKQFVQAKITFESCLEEVPDSALSMTYLDVCEVLINDPPDDSWNGTIEMKTK